MGRDPLRCASSRILSAFSYLGGRDRGKEAGGGRMRRQGGGTCMSAPRWAAKPIEKGRVL